MEPEMSAESGMAAFQDALGDYYDSGAIGAPPRRDDFLAPEPAPLMSQMILDGFGRYLDTRLGEMERERGVTTNFHKGDKP